MAVRENTTKAADGSRDYKMVATTVVTTQSRGRAPSYERGGRERAGLDIDRTKNTKVLLSSSEAMPILKNLIVSLIVLVLLSYGLVEANHEQKMKANDGGQSPGIAKKDCGVACATRCRLASRQNLCKRACGTCCARCNCVPPGTSGNQHLCPCYYAMTTHGGRRKCP
ncbi:Gibberellin-regulated protein 1 [Striga hermonthica]|uniref:Gibberellin-regulated protein 1 n=1 Tax=Striga hermonthica TaxID=68872 RepID=A0A9N7R808_STRHE|nr:Gibberellin-regulated protein 1 [Striga hermonthica]